MSVTAIDLSVPEPALLRARRSEKWSKWEPDVLSLTIAEMDFAVAEPIRSALVEAVQSSSLGYGAPLTPALIDALVGFAQRRMGWAIDPDHIAVVPDVMVGLLDLCDVLAGPQGPVAFALPAYPPFLSELGHSGRRIVGLRLSAEGEIDLAELEAALAGGVRVLVLSNPHNPTGRALRRAELAEIAELCAAHHAWVLADEIHAPLVLGGATLTPWLEVSDAARRWGMTLTSASKAFNVAALKLAFIVTASEPARAAAARVMARHDQGSLLGAVGLEVAFSRCDAWLDAVIAQLEVNRRRLGELLAEQLPAVRWQLPEATYLAWLDCRALGLGDDPAQVFVERGRVALSPGLDYGPPGAGWARLNFGTSPQLLAEAVARMAAAVREG